MRYWVQFLTLSTDRSILIDAPGTDGVYILDGRNSQHTMTRDAKRQAQRLSHIRRYAGFQLVKGERFTDEVKRGPVVLLSHPVQTG